MGSLSQLHQRSARLVLTSLLYDIGHNMHAHVSGPFVYVIISHTFGCFTDLNVVYHSTTEWVLVIFQAFYLV